MKRYKLDSFYELQDVPENVLDIQDLKEWGRSIRDVKSPVPRSSPKGSSLYSWIGSSRDESDDPQEGTYDPDKCCRIADVVRDIEYQYQKVLVAYYCQWPLSMRQCILNMPATDHLEPRTRSYSQEKSKYNRLSERVFTRRLCIAQGLVAGMYTERYKTNLN